MFRLILQISSPNINFCLSHFIILYILLSLLFILSIQNIALHFLRRAGAAGVMLHRLGEALGARRAGAREAPGTPCAAQRPAQGTAPPPRLSHIGQRHEPPPG